MKQQLTLGQFIFLLGRLEPTARVRFDFGGFVPGRLGSYRGYYEQLAIEYIEFKSEVDTVRASNLLEACNESLGKMFGGWKGGDYVMHENTPLWVDNPGKCNQTAIIGVIDKDYEAIIETQYKE